MQHSLSLSRPWSMSRVIPLLLAVLAVQLALAVLLALRTDPLTASTPQAPLIGAAAASADRLVIDATAAATDNTGYGAKSIVLEKRNGQWVLPQYFDAPARSAQVSSLLAQLVALRRGLPVATSSAALKRFQLIDSNFDRRLQLSQGGKTLGTIYLGNSASGVHKSYARTSGDHAAFSVDLANYQVPVQQSDWLDNGLISRDLGNLSEIDIATDPHQSLQLRHLAASSGPSAQPAAAAAPSSAAVAAAPKAPAANAPASSVWTASTSAGHEVDTSSVDTLARDVSQLQVQDVLGLQPKPEWQLEHPSLVLMLKASQAAAANVSWTLAKPSSGDYYVLKSSQYAWYFQVESSAAKQLIDASQTTALFKSAPAGNGSAAAAASKAAPSRSSSGPMPPRAGAAGQKGPGQP